MGTDARIASRIKLGSFILNEFPWTDINAGTGIIDGRLRLYFQKEPVVESKKEVDMRPRLSALLKYSTLSRSLHYMPFTAWHHCPSDIFRVNLVCSLWTWQLHNKRTAAACPPSAA